LDIYAVSAFTLGVMHALEPGHGKTVVAAYLVGSRGRASDAAILGLVVTLTHTISIIFLAILARAATNYFFPATIERWLGIISGSLVIAVGIWMLKNQIKGKNKYHCHSHYHNHQHILSNMPKHTHDHKDSQNEDQAQYIESNHITSPAGLITLGISGGLVPCPGALSILLASFAVGQPGNGITWILIFSSGLAVSLIVLGILITKTSCFIQNKTSLDKTSSWPATVSAGIITALGLFLTTKALLF